MLLSQLGSHKGSFFLLTSNPSGEVLLFEADPSRKREVAAFPIGSSIQFDPRPNCKDLLVLDQDGTFSLYTYDATSSGGSLELLSVGRLPSLPFSRVQLLHRSLIMNVPQTFFMVWNKCHIWKHELQLVDVSGGCELHRHRTLMTFFDDYVGITAFKGNREFSHLLYFGCPRMLCGVRNVKFHSNFTVVSEDAILVNGDKLACYGRMLIRFFGNASDKREAESRNWDEEKHMRHSGHWH